MAVPSYCCLVSHIVPFTSYPLFQLTEAGQPAGFHASWSNRKTSIKVLEFQRRAARRLEVVLSFYMPLFLSVEDRHLQLLPNQHPQLLTELYLSEMSQDKSSSSHGVKPVLSSRPTFSSTATLSTFPPRPHVRASAYEKTHYLAEIDRLRQANSTILLANWHDRSSLQWTEAMFVQSRLENEIRACVFKWDIPWRPVGV